MSTKFVLLLIFPIFFFSICIKFNLTENAAPSPANVVDKETIATIDEFIKLGQKINKNPNAEPDKNEIKEIQKKWFDQEDFDKDGQVTVDEGVKYMMEKMMPYMMGMATDKKNGDKMTAMMREMVAADMGLMDTDKDVRLSHTEFEKGFAKMIEGVVADAKQKHSGQ